MNANELRIGNIIYLRGHLHDREIRLDGVEREMELSGFILGKLLSYRPGKNFDFISEVKPIPLTEEWLVKFGFEKVNSCYEEAETFDFILQPLYFDMANQSIKINGVYQKISYPKYVHQLQNLYFALTGEELKLKQ